MKQAARGFTLIEVLIALAIVSIALAAVMRSVAVATDDQSRLRDRRPALLCAQDRWQELRLSGQAPQDDRQRCVQAQQLPGASASGHGQRRPAAAGAECGCRRCTPAVAGADAVAMDGGVMTRAVRGFTLIEVMIAITIMGVLALICWRALDSVANSNQRLRRPMPRPRRRCACCSSSSVISKCAQTMR